MLSVFNTQTVRHVLKTQYYLYIYERCITFFMKISQVPSYNTLYQSPANTFHVLVTSDLYTYVKDV